MELEKIEEGMGRVIFSLAFRSRFLSWYFESVPILIIGDGGWTKEGGTKEVIGGGISNC